MAAKSNDAKRGIQDEKTQAQKHGGKHTGGHV
jgi:hypothetical protein